MLQINDFEMLKKDIELKKIGTLKQSSNRIDVYGFGHVIIADIHEKGERAYTQYLEGDTKDLVLELLKS